MRYLIIPITLAAMQNHDGKLSLIHKRAEYTRKDKAIIEEKWDIEADCYRFDWPEKEHFKCLRSPTVKAAVVAGCASVSAAAIAALAILLRG